MIPAVGLYLRRYVRPNLRKIVLSPQVLVSMGVALLIVAHPTALSGYLTTDITGVLVNYNFMVFGFTIAALAIVFAVPTQRFVSFLIESERRLPDSITGPWESALFIMSWNGFVHFCALVATITTLILCFDYTEPTKQFAYDATGLGTKAVFWAASALQIYALLQFLASLLSVYFFCAVFITHAKSSLDETINNGGQPAGQAQPVPTPGVGGAQQAPPG
jgi:TRAP-type C4-dicarboxylate transport system permease small subunit